MNQRTQRTESAEIVVFSIVRSSKCSECKAELWKGEFLRMEDGAPLCLSCADLDQLEFLPSGDTALTRRGSKYSALRAVVVRFSRSRKRYERQGVLVEHDALVRAERECLEDAEGRARARERAAARREVEDQDFIAVFAQRVTELYPGAPPSEATAIARHACVRSSGRVGRSAAAKELEASAVHLAVRAHVRHEHTGYDELMGRGASRSAARSQVRDEIERVLASWGDLETS